MNVRTLKQYLAEGTDSDAWTVTLKSGEEVVCRPNPAKDCMEVAYQQTLAKETLCRGDIIKPREILGLDNQ
jgi:hypothetical protein